MRRCAGLALLAAGTTALLCACGDEASGPTINPRAGEWEGPKVGFVVEDGLLSDWALWGMFCEGEDETGTKCLRHPSSSYTDVVVAVKGTRILAQLDSLTLEAELADEEHLSGTWTLDPGDCCTAEGEWTAEHVADPPEPDPSETEDTGATGGGDTGGPQEVPQILDSAVAVCARWNADRADLSAPITTANTSTCSAGTIDAPGHARAVKQIDLFRALAGLEPVTTSTDLDAMAQSCSLMMEANEQISHTPPSSWTCFSEDGATSAARSNLATADAVNAIAMYMIDWGHPTTLGHRRWILQRSNGPFGVGSAPGYSCLHALDTTSEDSSPAAWSAWPPPGWFPIQANSLPYGGSLDDAGWSIQAYVPSLTGAEVEVSDSSGVLLEVQVNMLEPGYGNAPAIRIVPDGWAMTVGETYTVAVGGISPPIIYSFEVVDCGG